MTLVINLFGGPCAGKSATSFGVVSYLKFNGIDAEHVAEYAKDLVWEKRSQTLNDQYYIFGKQHNRLNRVRGKVEVAVTDCPLLLGLYYIKPVADLVSSHFPKTILDAHHMFNNKNYFLKRVGPYNENGRLQTEEQANDVSDQLEGLLKDNHVEYKTMPGSWDSVVDISNQIIRMLRS